MRAALTGRALATWRGSGADAGPQRMVVDKLWFEEAGGANLGDRQEAEGLG